MYAIRSYYDHMLRDNSSLICYLMVNVFDLRSFYVKTMMVVKSYLVYDAPVFKEVFYSLFIAWGK